MTTDMGNVAHKKSGHCGSIFTVSVSPSVLVSCRLGSLGLIFGDD